MREFRNVSELFSHYSQCNWPSLERKYAMESNGFHYLENLLQAYSPDLAVELRELWEEYEKKETPAAKWVNTLDKLECLTQAHEYERRTFGEKDLEEFQGLKAKIHSEVGCEWAAYLSQERSKHLSRRARRLPIIFILGMSSTEGKKSCLSR